MTDIVYAGRWYAGDTGLEAQYGNAGRINIAHGDEEIWSLLSFIQHHYPKVFRKWLEEHPDAHPTLKKHLPPTSITVPWAEKVFKLPSHSGGKPHIVTVSNGRFSCTCEAYNFGKTCWAMHKIMREVNQNEPSQARA